MTEDKPTVKVRLTNHLTGEITDIEIDSEEKAKNLYLELRASASVIKKAQESLLYYLDQFLGQDEEFRFHDGHYIRRVQRTSLIYRPEVVKKYLKEYLDKDTYNAAMEVITKIDQKAADVLIAEMVEKGELPAGTLKKIREEADMKSTKPYVEVK